MDDVAAADGVGVVAALVVWVQRCWMRPYKSVVSFCVGGGDIKGK